MYKNKLPSINELSEISPTLENKDEIDEKTENIPVMDI